MRASTLISRSGNERGKPVKAKKTEVVRVTRFRSFFHLGLALTDWGPQALKQNKERRQKGSLLTQEKGTANLLK